MGNNNVKKNCSSAYDLKLDGAFISLSNSSPTINFNNLKRSWTQQLDPDLYNTFENYLKNECRGGVTKQIFKNFFSGLCNCDEEEKAKCIIRIISNGETVRRSELLQFLVSVLKTVLIIQEQKSIKSFRSWRNRSSVPDEQSITLFGQYFLNNLNKNDKLELNWEDIKSIFVHFDIFLSMTLTSIYQTEEDEFYAHLLPRWKYEPIESGRTLQDFSVLDLVKIMFINFELPIDYQTEWRLLFSSAISGESFSRLTGQIINKGPTIIIIKDRDEHIFGGFAPDNWNMSPNFIGDSRSFLFTLLPEMKIYSPTGFNSNFQYMNVGQQTLPNGLGMGGKLEYFGLWLSADYGTGYCSESCTTYRNYKMMSGTKNFSVSHVEVWGVGPPPPTPAELGERSVLDGNIEAQAILELAGKTKYSEGLREEPKD